MCTTNLILFNAPAMEEAFPDNVLGVGVSQICVEARKVVVEHVKMKVADVKSHQTDQNAYHAGPNP